MDVLGFIVGNWQEILLVVLAISVAAGIIVKSIAKLMNITPGTDPDSLLSKASVVIYKFVRVLSKITPDSAAQERALDYLEPEKTSKDKK